MGHRFDPYEPRNRRSRRRPRISRFWGDFRRYRAALSVSADTCGLSSRFRPPVSASKNSVPRGRVFDGQIPVGCREFLGFGRPKATFRTRSVIIADSIQGLRTAGSILPERHEVARLQYRVANDGQSILLAPKAKKARTIPLGAGDGKSDLGEAVIGLAIPGKPI